VESTYSWYWLVDGLMEAGFPVCLAHTGVMAQYAGLKYSNDLSDARYLAHLLRLGILPTGYIYPKEERGLRDLLRRCLLLVRQKTLHHLSLQRQILPREDYQLLQSIPGVGPVLGMTIALETGIIQRFPSPGHYASYARCMKSEKISNGKRKGQGNKNGNKYWREPLWRPRTTLRSGAHRSNATTSASSLKATS
jgi:transposase